MRFVRVKGKCSAVHVYDILIPCNNGLRDAFLLVIKYMYIYVPQEVNICIYWIKL